VKKYLTLSLNLVLTLSLKAQLSSGEWHAAISLNDNTELPFTFTSYEDSIIIHNGEEKIRVSEITYNGDSIFIQMPVFDSEFRCKFSEHKLTGFFINHSRRDKNIFPFHAEEGLAYRFSDKPERTNLNITGRYLTVFDSEDEISKNAIGIFKQDGNYLSGTFLTVTGDYRFLEGEVAGNRMLLSAFDGSHLFLFTAIIKGDSLVDGHYYSGQHWHDTWHGVKNENAELSDPEKFVAFTNKEGEFNFAFPDENGKLISSTDEQFKGKALIIQIMGSWCPNCMDETKFLSKWRNEKNPRCEIIALDFEKITDTAIVKRNILRLKKQFDIRYPVLFAGSNDKSEAARKLRLNTVIAFPTLIFIDKNKRAITTHSGFSGPATGNDFEKFQKWFIKTTDRICGE
jgi:thiol-disulfide isomerase/thioredoxin